MTIKSKLIANVLVTTAIIGVISLASFLSMSFLQKKLLYLTERSTPFQVRTIEMQRELYGCITALVKVNAARTLAEYSIFRAEFEQSLTGVDNAQQRLKKMSAGTPGLTGELGTVAQKLFTASEDRINSTIAATAANTKVQQSMKESSDRLNELDSSIRSLQVNYSKAFAAALEHTDILSRRLGSIEELRNLVRELQLLAVTVQNPQNSTAVLIAKGKLKSVAVRIAKNEFYSSNKSIASITAGFTDKLAEYIRLQSVALAQNDDDSKNRAAAAGKDLPYKLNDLFQTLDQETMMVRDELALARSKQEVIFSQSNRANNVLVANSVLVSQGLRVTGETNRLFSLESVVGLNSLDSEIRTLFNKINERVHTIESSLTGLNAKAELKMLRTASGSLAAIHTELFSTGGIVTALKKKLDAFEQAKKATDTLHSIVIKQSAQGNENVSAAQDEQEKSIIAVNIMVKRSLSQILGIGSVAIVFGILFGYWIYRSVLLPLRVILDAVHAQQEQAKENATLAEAVAGGDLNREVIIREVLSLYPEQIKKDEMGMVLAAVVGMSTAQVTLDKALAGMTASLRGSTLEENRRVRLKSGLNELNTILRGERKTSDLTEMALAYMAGFVGAGVGIMYLYDEKTKRLETRATYAISKSKRLNEGFLLGEGLVGQVALEKKYICFDTVPPDYLPITAALAESEPLHVAIMPIMYNEILVGVLELGSFRAFGVDDFDFLNKSLEGVAIAINVNHSRQQINNLLEQAQQQTEELHVQQGELQQANEELEERARMLAKQRRIP